MKKSLLVISASVAMLAVALTACSKTDSTVIPDNSGNTHVLVTDKNGDKAQDEYGNLIEEVTNSSGEKVTQVYGYPEVSTNKRSSIMENSNVRVKVPKGWKSSGDTSVFRLRHKGECVSMDVAPCQIEIDVTHNLTQKEAYEQYKQTCQSMMNLSSDISDMKEYETEINGKKTLAISYHVDSEDTTVYYYCVSNGLPNVEITVSVYDKCYENDSSVIELLNSCMTFKNLGTASAE